MHKYKTTLHLLLAVLLPLLLASCTHPFTKGDNSGEQPVAQTKQERTPVSTWQQAYGEPQDSQINKPAATTVDNEQAQTITPAPTRDLWQRIRNGYGIASPSLHSKTQKQLDWFVKHPEYIDRVVERARPYLHYIVDEIERRNMPLEIALLPVVESGFQPFAHSQSSASGLWQFIPGTGKVYGLEQNWWYDGRRDVIESTHAALDYLQKLHNDFGDWQLALAAYNCGEGTVGRAIKRNKKVGKAIDFWSLDLPKETSVYVPKLMAVAHLVAKPEKYQISLSSIDNSPFLTVVELGSQIDLAIAAKLAGISTDELYQLNPGFNRWATRPEGPHNLVVPLEKAVAFQQALADLPANERVQWTRHKIKTGESLGLIAKHYKTTVGVLKEANAIAGNNIRAGSYLLIPIASGEASAYPVTVSQALATRQNKQQSGDKKIHTVTAGDTWWDLANTYNVDVRQLTTWNSKTPNDTLSLGQKLIVWTKDKNKALSKNLRSVKYKIRSGDSLWKISQKFNVSVAQVREWNGLSDRTLLRPGQNLTLYIDDTKQHGSI